MAELLDHDLSFSRPQRPADEATRFHILPLIPLFDRSGDSAPQHAPLWITCLQITKAQTCHDGLAIRLSRPARGPIHGQHLNNEHQAWEPSHPLEQA